MQKIEKKQKKSGSRMMQTGIALLALAVIAAAVILLLPREEPVSPEKTAEEAGFVHPDEAAALVLPQHGEDGLASLSVTLDSGENWTAVRDAQGWLVRSGADAFEPFYGEPFYMSVVTQYALLLEEAEVLAADFGAYAEHRADFGLDTPRMTAALAYTDGTSLTVYIGSAEAAGEIPGRYMLAEGRPELFLAENEVWKELYIEAEVLRPTGQPTVHAARIDRVTLTDADGVREWALDAAITEPDAADRWSLVQPYRYAADGDAMETLRKNLANLRMGTWVAQATAEARTAYGFDAPRAVITAHMAPGTIMTSGPDGAALPTDFGEATFTLQLGNPRNDMVDYVLWEDNVYRMPHWMVSSVLDTEPLNTLTRYPVLTSLSNLKHLTLESAGEAQVWIVKRSLRVAENNELVTDPSGVPVQDITLTRNGVPEDWEAFSIRYNRLLQATVSGVLPEGWESDAPPHTLLTFETETDTVHTIALTDFDRSYDAVWVDGSAVFYIKKGALALTE